MPLSYHPIIAMKLAVYESTFWYLGKKCIFKFFKVSKGDHETWEIADEIL